MDRRDPPLAAPEAAREASLVRPYALTAGRTGTDIDLPLEAPVQTSRAGLAAPVATQRRAGQDCPVVPHQSFGGGNLRPSGSASGCRASLGG